MKIIDLVYRDIRLRVVCDDYIEPLIRKQMVNHVSIEEPTGEARFTLLIGDNIENLSGRKYKMLDKWFNNATLDCYIDNYLKVIYATNFNASSEKNKNLLINYFVANLFNRFLELDGYLGIHSSCVEKDNNGVLFIAERYNGKTICMLNLMNDGFNSVTNDKIALKKIDDEMVGYGIAQDVSIRLGPAFCSKPENQKYVEIAKKKGIEIKPKEMIEGNNMHLTDAELAEVNGVKQTIDAPIKCIIRPCYDPLIKHPTFDRMSEDWTRELVYSQYLPLVHETTDFLIEIKEEGKDETDRYKMFNEVTNIPAYYCRQNENTTEEFVEGVKKLIKKE